MDNYKQNAKWLTYLAPFRLLSISAAYLVPFFLQKGLSLSQVFLLQSVFSVAVVVWELPSGYIADRFGRAFTIKLSVPVAALAMIAYGFSDRFWQFVVWEVVLALANGLVSGVDTALLLDSLKADGREAEFVKLKQRINAVGYAGTAVGVPIAVVLVHFVGISSTLVADGLLSLVGVAIALKLVEAPRISASQEAVTLSAWHSVKKLGRSAEARWLVTLGSALSTATYMGFWLSASYYTSLGIPVVLFSVILAFRSLWKAWLSHRFTQGKRVQRNLVIYASLTGFVYVTMSSGYVWLVWLVFGHDVVQALHSEPVTAKLNVHISHEYRATLNSLVNLVQRLVFSLAGPLVGLLVDRAALRVGLLVTGLTCSTVAFAALARLRNFGTFD